MRINLNNKTNIKTIREKKLTILFFWVIAVHCLTRRKKITEIGFIALTKNHI
jgi:hypothetical protein